MTLVGDLHGRVAELLGAFVLHAVEPDEAEMVESHLEECPRCRTEVDQLREVAAAIGNSSEPPPGALWERIAADVAQRPDDASQPDGAPRGSSERSRAGAGPLGLIVGMPEAGRSATGLRVRGAGHGRARSRPWTVVGVGAAAACAALAVVFGVNWTDANSRVGQLQAALARQGAGAAIEAALVSPGHQVVELRTTDGVPLAEVVVRRGGAGYVVSSHMPALPSDMTYQLWAKIDDRPISVGLLGAKPGIGDAFSLGSSTGAVRELMVTVEPSRGVISPSVAPIATAALD